MRHFLAFFAGLIIFSFVCVSAQTDKSLIGGPSAKTIMGDVFNHVKALVPYMMSSEAMNKKENEQIILGHMINLTQAFNNATHTKDFGKVGIAPSLETMREHMQNTVESFNRGHKDFALLRLKAATHLCLSCHSQLPKSKTLTFSSFRSQVKASEFADKAQFAEFLFLLRDYPNAQKNYLEEIKDTISKMRMVSKEDPQVFEIHNPYSRHISLIVKKLMAVNLKGQRDISKAQKTLDLLSQEKNFPKIVSSEIKDYQEQLKKLTLLKWPTKFKHDGEIEQFISKEFEAREEELKSGFETHDLGLLYASGTILEYLFTHQESKAAPKALFWISVGERAMARNYFYSLADVYLKECIKLYPGHHYARKCYEEYENHLVFGYTGTSGTNIPSEEKKELEKLKKMIK